MNEAGELIEWDDARGFGFVRSRDGDRLFVHATAFQRSVRRPQIGDRVMFRRGPGRDGRPAVVAVQIAGATSRPVVRGPSAERVEQALSARLWRICLAALLMLALIFTHDIGRTPDWLLLAYALVSIASASAYWIDKRAAEAGRWRISEATLHMLDFAGGIIGGLLAQAALRHKTAKPGFAAVTMLIGASHLVLFGLLWLGIAALR